MKKITIAIDGYSSCGKSTIAKEIAKKLNYIYVDTGAMYRAVTLFALQQKLISNNVVDDNLKNRLSEIFIDFKINKNGDIETILNGINVETEIRTPKISKLVSYVSAIKEVREKLVNSQQEIGKNGGVVMDGRDIGTVVFPCAELKLFITAHPTIRAERRYKELTNKGIKTSVEEVKENLLKRDEHDITRIESPLKKAKDAIEFDNSNITIENQNKKLLNLALSIIEKN